MRVNLLVFVVVAAACSHAPAAERSMVDHSRPTKTLDQTPVADIPGAVEATYRVRPDRRFLLAAADVVELTTGHRPAEVSIELANNRWRIRVDGENAGELPDLASFDDGLSMLTRLAAAAHPSHTTQLSSQKAAHAEGKIAQIDEPRAQFEALQEIGNANDKRALQLGARALVFVNMLTNDPYDTADALRARALALVAIATNVDQEAAILARVFGYEHDALAAATKPEADSFTTTLAWPSGELGNPAPELPESAALASPLGGGKPFPASHSAHVTAALKKGVQSLLEQRAS